MQSRHQSTARVTCAVFVILLCTTAGHAVAQSGVRVGNCWTDYSGRNHCGPDPVAPRATSPNYRSPPIVDPATRAAAADAHAQAAFDRGKQLFNSGKYAEAEPEFWKAVGHWWQDANLRGWIALTFERQGKYRWALPQYEVQLEYDPGNAWALASIGRCHQALGDHKRALASYQRALTFPHLAPGDRSDIEAAIAALNAPKPEQVPERRRATVTIGGRIYQQSGNALIGGTTWAVGYNVQTANPKVVEQARAMLKDNLTRAGIDPRSIDVDRFNFVLGVAHSTDAWLDLLDRVRRDEKTEGRFSAQNQEAYSSLKGRSFGELACHSNGAMVCLAGLTARDIVAQKVVLYGPQITGDSLKMWEGLVREGRVKSVEIHVHEGDPVPAVSMMWARGKLDAATRTALGAAHPSLMSSYFLTDNLGKAINHYAPSARLEAKPCASGIALDCHYMTSYRQDAR